MFEGIVADCRMLPPALVAPFARALPFVEPATVLALPVPATVAAGAVLSAALLAAFAGAMAVDILRGRTGIDCGCFLGALPQRIGWPLVVRNLLLVAGSLALPLLAAPAAAGEVRRVGEVQEDYARNCQGPHRADGLGAYGSVPRIRGFVGLFTHLPEGRDHLIRVPGVVWAMLDDERLARLVNRMLHTCSPDELAPDFRPCTAEEIRAARRRPLAEVKTVRAADRRAPAPRPAATRRGRTGLGERVR